MTIHHGDCVTVMAAMPEASIDAIVCDPPYGLEFMGKEWDRLGGDGWRAGGFGKPGIGDRPTQWTAHGDTANATCATCGGRMRGANKCACDDPDWRVRGEPVGKRNAAMAQQEWHAQWAAAALRVAKPGAYLLAFGGTRTVHRMTVALEDAGWIIRDMLVWAYASGFPKSRALLKPAWEPIVMARKPGPLRDLDIDGCRIDGGGPASGWSATGSHAGPNLAMAGANTERAPKPDNPAGRWPANVILTDPLFDGDTEGVVGGGRASDSPSDRTMPNRRATRTNIYGGGDGIPLDGVEVFGYGDTGTYSRFFLIPKASRSDREPVMPGMLEEREAPKMSGGDFVNPMWGSDSKRTRRRNVHPTVKPVELMRHLVRLVTPPDGTVLDPFLGSGTTAIAAEQEGRAWVGIEREAEYVRIAEARLAGTQRGLGLVS